MLLRRLMWFSHWVACVYCDQCCADPVFDVCDIGRRKGCRTLTGQLDCTRITAATRRPSSDTRALCGVQLHAGGQGKGDAMSVALVPCVVMQLFCSGCTMSDRSGNTLHEGWRPRAGALWPRAPVGKERDMQKFTPKEDKRALTELTGSCSSLIQCRLHTAVLVDHAKTKLAGVYHTTAPEEMCTVPTCTDRRPPEGASLLPAHWQLSHCSL